MTGFGELLNGIAIILWPIIIIILIILFKPAIAAIIESAKSRKFTLKIGNQELTVEEASKQERDVIKDLQDRLIKLESQIIKTRGKKVEKIKPAHEVGAGGNGDIQSSVSLQEPPADRHQAQSISILWVDDNPKNNGYLVQLLQDADLTVDLALSTADGLKRFNQGQYNFVISDMGRREKGSYNHSAGLDLLRKIRAENQKVPFVILTTSQNVKAYASKAYALGGTSITSSPTELFGVLQREMAKSWQPTS